ncbi:chemotaxis protein CheW [Azoarcus indigens]|uniref:Twitching motility protein PilI n=1 Tax=Azoarcus indigens TaxID=29545 RepID=A0A4R6E960_9RHOO|nr:chemotaxis protein CheW [Azoarcus indigens]NMG67557.1 chemotaxis protein CheW [Azoarcus indigens]TDN53548.1 twitching motility protein PilI [Azoarcus indigens]
MSKRISLREFQESLVRRLAEAKSGERRGLLGVQAGNENWLVALADSGEVLPPPPLSPVPLTRPWYRGLANVRGTLYGVVDFSAFHGGPLVAPSGHARLLLVGARHGVHCALLVSRASGLRSGDDFEADDNPADERPWVGQRLRDVQDRPWLRLDVQRLLAHPGFLDAGAG